MRASASMPGAPASRAARAGVRCAVVLLALMALSALPALAPGAGSGGNVWAVGPARAAAQAIDGVALDADGRPIPDIPVALHHVGAGGTGAAGSTVTDADGRFRFPIESPDSAVYFAVMRYEGQMYIGPAVGPAGAEEYELRAVPSAEAGAVAEALSGGSTGGSMGGVGGGVAPGAAMAPVRARDAGNDTGALLIVGLLAIAAAAVFVLTAPRYRERRTRDALIDLATVENRLAGEPADADRPRLEARRRRLRERLSPRG